MLWTLIKRDFVLETRRLEGVVGASFLSIALLSLLTVGLNSAGIGETLIARFAPVLLWVVVFVGLASSSSRLAEYDEDSKALDGLILAGTSFTNLYFARVLSLTGLSLIAFLVSAATTAGLMWPQLFSHLLPLLLVATLVGLGSGALAALIGPISVKARARGLLMPLLLLPLIFPLFFAAVEIGVALNFGEPFNIGSWWLSLLVSLDAVYLALGVNLYPHVVRA